MSGLSSSHERLQMVRRANREASIFSWSCSIQTSADRHWCYSSSISHYLAQSTCWQACYTTAACPTGDWRWQNQDSPICYTRQKGRSTASVRKWNNGLFIGKVWVLKMPPGKTSVSSSRLSHLFSLENKICLKTDTATEPLTDSVNQRPGCEGEDQRLLGFSLPFYFSLGLPWSL